MKTILGSILLGVSLSASTEDIKCIPPELAIGYVVQEVYNACEEFNYFFISTVDDKGVPHKFKLWKKCWRKRCELP